MARESTIQVLYGNAATTAPVDLSDGEFAFAHGNDKLFIGANGDNTAVWVGAEILDEDTMSSDSATSLATQQSIKAYVDSAIGASAGVVSIEGLNGVIDLDANTGITFTTSGGDTITFSGTDATTSAKGVASFTSADFSVSSGAVSLSDTVLKAITTDTGGMIMSGHAISLLGGEGMDVTHSGTSITIAGEDASTSNKGIASFTSGDFTASSGAISLNDAVVKSVTTDSGALTPSTHAFSILGGEGMDVTHTGTTITVAGEDASTSNKGVASFDSGDFSVSSGAVSLADSATGAVIAISGTSNEVEVSRTNGTVTVGLPDDVTIAGNLTVNGTVTTIDTTNLAIEDPLISLGINNNATDSVDIGFFGLYDTSGSQDLYCGLFRDASDSGKFKLFVDSQSAPTTTVNTAATGYSVATLVANISGGSF